MIIWTIKLLKTVKKAIAGRKYPHQLAGAVAVGALLGVVPHGNLLALIILLVVISLRINHAMAGLTAIGVSFAATRLDPISHEVGQYVLTNPRWGETASRAWQWPLVPWTDLNNTIVMGSFLIGLAAIVPIFTLTLPVFKAFAISPEEEQEIEAAEARRRTRNVAKHSVVLVDQGTQEVSSPHPSSIPAPRVAKAEELLEETARITTRRIDKVRPLATTAYLDEAANKATRDEDAAMQSEPEAEQHVSVETRIDVIRMKDYVKDPITKTAVPAAKPAAEKVSEPPSDEALNYLLRQLRDSQQQRKAG